MPTACHTTPAITQTITPHPAPWERYRRPYVRDLAFAIACPDVLARWIDFAPYHNTTAVSVHSRAFWQSQFEHYQARLDELDNTDAYQALTRFLLTRPSPNRLGFHFEGLLSFWLKDGFALSLHPYETLASNVQLYSGKQTTGELDLILYNHENRCTEHWELAIKFFMGAHPFTPSQWVGINSNDNLERKMTHMQTKQFQAVWVDTQANGRVKIDKRFAVIKGRFFLPKQSSDQISKQPLAQPDWMTPNFPLHEWVDTRDTAALAHIDTAMLRRAHYIEWFTKREFYDARLSHVVWAADEVPATGLYFEGDTPLVIYPQQPARANDQH